MNELVISIAGSFSAEYLELHGLQIPADDYFDPIVEVFGESPSKDDAKAILNERIADFATELSEWLEIELNEESVRDTLYRALVNFYGDTIDD